MLPRQTVKHLSEGGGDGDGEDGGGVETRGGGEACQRDARAADCLAPGVPGEG